MSWTSRCLNLFALFALLMAQATLAHGAATFTLTPIGNGQYALKGTGLTGVAGVDVHIQYDTSTLSNPRIVQGSLVAGSQMVTNTSEPGQVHIATIDAYPKVETRDGTIAVLSFDGAASSSGSAPLLSVRAVDVKGASLPVQSTVSLVPDTSPSSEGTASTSQPTAAGSQSTQQGQGTTVSGGSPVWLGTVTQQNGNAGEHAVSRETQGSPQMAPQSAQETQTASIAPETTTPLSATAETKERKFLAQKSVLDRFRDYRGEMSPRALMLLFEKGGVPGIRQVPAVVLSDGKSRAKLFLKLRGTGRKAPNFALKGARLISLRLNRGNEWVVEAQPDVNAVSASVTVLHEGIMTEIPLTVAPPLPASLKLGKGAGLTVDEFELFLAKRGTGKAPLYDLNSDGKRDYLDDYIFTANFLAQRHHAKKPAARKKR